ncbi:unnamed protein product [Sphagnum troendelagicum]|uniref:Uncharacterized protein n=1 Tax=Sphagnum troendelagicum TaxID=128251 RepID=A0ABP0U0H5_9BRYO
MHLMNPQAARRQPGSFTMQMFKRKLRSDCLQTPSTTRIHKVESASSGTGLKAFIHLRDSTLPRVEAVNSEGSSVQILVKA